MIILYVGAGLMYKITNINFIYDKLKVSVIYQKSKIIQKEDTCVKYLSINPFDKIISEIPPKHWTTVTLKDEENLSYKLLLKYTINDNEITLIDLSFYKL